MMIEVDRSKPMTLKKPRKSGQRIDRSSKLVLDIPLDDESNEVNKSAFEKNSVEQLNQYLGSNQSESVGNAGAKSKVSVQQTEGSVHFGDKVSRGSQEDRQMTAKVHGE
jgi:hypothetical protein